MTSTMHPDQAPASRGPTSRRPGAARMVAAAAAGVVAVAGFALASGTIELGGAGKPLTEPRVSYESPVTAMDHEVGPGNNSPVLVADPTEPLFVVSANRVDGPDFSCALNVSGDGGKSWVSANPVPELPAGAEKCYGPEAAFDGRGKLYFLYVGLAGSGNQPMGIFLTSSTDRGASFDAPRPILGPLNFSVRMAIDPSMGKQGRIHLAWLHATSTGGIGALGPPPNPILAAHSDDGGLTFSEPIQVSDPARERVVATALALGPGHAVHVGYYDLGDDTRDYQNLEGPTWAEPWSVVVARSFDGGEHFTTGEVVDGEIVPPERVMLIFTMPPPALVAHEDLLCAAWNDARHGDPDVLLRCSPDRGATWNPASRINDDPVGNGIRQYLPRLGVSPSGRLDAVFLDRRRDPGNGRNDLVYAHSEDGGRSFARNMRLSSEASEAAIGGQYEGPGAAGQFEWGGRLGLLSRRSDALVAWPDTRNAMRAGQDLFAARVVVSDESKTWAGPRLVGLVIGLAGLLVAVIALSSGRRARRGDR